jgi:hypothetical protein
MRSAEDDFGIQTKFFVNQQLVEKSDPKLMQSVYGKQENQFIRVVTNASPKILLEKTLNMIFNGAKLQNQKQLSVANINGNPMSPVLDSVEDVGHSQNLTQPSQLMRFTVVETSRSRRLYALLERYRSCSKYYL